MDDVERDNGVCGGCLRIMCEDCRGTECQACLDGNGCTLVESCCELCIAFCKYCQKADPDEPIFFHKCCIKEHEKNCNNMSRAQRMLAGAEQNVVSGKKDLERAAAQLSRLQASIVPLKKKVKSAAQDKEEAEKKELEQAEAQLSRLQAKIVSLTKKFKTAAQDKEEAEKELQLEAAAANDDSESANDDSESESDESLIVEQPKNALIGFGNEVDVGGKQVGQLKNPVELPKTASIVIAKDVDVRGKQVGQLTSPLEQPTNAFICLGKEVDIRENQEGQLTFSI